MKTRYKYIEFVEEHVGGKTRKFFCRNHETGAYIGEIAWAGNWRKYVFFTANGVMFDSGCLDDISDFLKKLMSDWREKKQKAKQSP